MFLSKELINAAKDIKTEEVDVPEWGGKVLIAELSGTNRSKFELYLRDARQTDDFSKLRESLVVLCLVDEKGQNLYDEKEAQLLGDRNSLVLDRLFDVATKLNKLFDSQLEEEIKKS